MSAQKLHGVPHPLSCEVNGRRWELFGCEYESPDGKFAFYIYALSRDHAEMLLTELKQTARVLGKLEGVYG